MKIYLGTTGNTLYSVITLSAQLFGSTKQVSLSPLLL